jgi:hypothetical protein
MQGFNSEALAQCQSAADVEHKLDELEDLHQVQYVWSCNAWVRRLRQSSEMFVQDLADDVGMELEELYMGYWEDSDSECDSGTVNADSNLGICNPDNCQRECLHLLDLKRCLPARLRTHFDDLCGVGGMHRLIDRVSAGDTWKGPRLSTQISKGMLRFVSQTMF